MATKHKEHIIQILKRSGPLTGAVIKERVMNDLNLEDDEYPKSTFQRHLEQLVHDAKISVNQEGSKRIYFIQEFKHPVQGGLLIEALGGKITAPNILLPFDIKIDQGKDLGRDNKEFHLFLEFNSTNICLSIHKDAVAFNIHISRFIDGKSSEKVIKEFGPRTIVIELPVATISSFKPETLTGHILLNFGESGEVKVTELGATNPAESIEISGLSLDSFSNEISIIAAKTVQNEVNQRSDKITGRTKFQKGEIKVLALPTMILMSSDSTIAIF